MGVLTVSICGFSTALVCDRISAMVDTFNPGQAANGLEHFLIRPTEIATLTFLIFLALMFYGLALYNVYPYNFTDLINQINKSNQRRGKRDLLSHSASPFFGGGGFNNNYNCSSNPLLRDDLEDIDQIFVGLKSIDMDGCFMKKICQMNQETRSHNNLLNATQEFLLDFIRRKTKESSTKNKKKDVWTTYEEAIDPEIFDCNLKYKSCQS